MEGWVHMANITRRQALELSAGLAGGTLVGCRRKAEQGGDNASAAQRRTIQILASSDLHGKLTPWDYTCDEESTSGSVAQMATAIAELRDDSTILVDVGDSIQDNMADLFLADEVHPMIACLNALHYDIGVVGNHEFDYGMDVVRKTIASFEGKVVTGNVIDEHGDPLADGYTIVERDGIQFGIIGMVTPNITHWNAKDIEGCTVSNPVEETRRIIDEIADQVDVLIAACHMGIDNEQNTFDTGVRDLAMACPELDVILAAHSHTLVEGEVINGVLVVENKHQAQTMSQVKLTLERDGEHWKLLDKSSKGIIIKDYDPDPDILELVEPYDERAKDYAREVVGTLVGGPLAAENEIADIPTAFIQDTAVVDLINDTQLHYSGADVSATPIFKFESNMQPGDIHRSDVSKVYKHPNTLYTLWMTGAQLRKHMEWSAGMYRQWQPGDLTIGFDSSRAIYKYDMFQGVTYEIDISREMGSRIQNLAWPDGRPVKDDDTFTIVVNDHRADNDLLTPGTIFSEDDDLPRLLRADICGSYTNVREMIAAFITDVRGGVISPDTNDNWRIVGNDWDPALHEQAVELIRNGDFTLIEEEERWRLSDKVVTEKDLKA